MTVFTNDVDRIEAEAREWFLLQQERPLTAAEQEQYQQWLKLDGFHREAYQQLVEIWQGLGELELSAERQVPASWLSSLAQTFQDRLLGLRGFPFAAPYALASLVAVVMVSTLWLLTASGNHEQILHFQSDIAQVKTIRLDDGSSVTLGADSQIEVSFTADRRDVHLAKGQAFFDVTKDQQRPFFVDADQADVMVVGTRFEVYRQLDQIKVIVEEGVVKVSSSSEPDFSSRETETLSAGQKLVSLADAQAVVSEIDAESVSPWREGRLVYRDAALENVVFDVNRYRDEKIILGTDSLKKLKVTTSLAVDQTDSIVSMLEQSLPVVAHQETDSRILILPKSSLM
ncbi:MAG: FecR family protein [Cellvibrionaceae bacterium]